MEFLETSLAACDCVWPSLPSISVPFPLIFGRQASGFEDSSKGEGAPLTNSRALEKVSILVLFVGDDSKCFQKAQQPFLALLRSLPSLIASNVFTVCFMQMPREVLMFCFSRLHHTKSAAIRHTAGQTLGLLSHHLLPEVPLIRRSLIFTSLRLACFVNPYVSFSCKHSRVYSLGRFLSFNPNNLN